jgi:Cu(I)/Ag(I) efflux system periplasmic protein CusF
MKTSLATTLAAAWLAAATPSIAQQAQPAQPAQPAQSSESADTEAEVRKVDKSAGKITLKHGEIKNFDMAPMTMVFGVKDASMLAQVKAGDKIRFRAAKESGKFTVTEIVAPIEGGN